jgi:Spx/MgsR family transcriptional regulator
MRELSPSLRLCAEFGHHCSMKNSAIHVYGIPNCGSVKKVRVWLEGQGQAYLFHDFKKEGVDPAALDHWLQQVGWETLVNRKGTTWRQLDATEQAKVTNAASARSLMLAHPSVIKRPVVVAGAARQVTVGVNEEAWSRVTS